MKTRNTPLQDKLAKAQQFIKEKIALLPGSIALKEEEKKFALDQASQETKNLLELNSLQKQPPKLYPHVKKGEDITAPLLDEETKFNRPPITAMWKNGVNQELCGSLTQSGCGEVRTKKTASKGQFSIYCNCLAKEENGRRMGKNATLMQAYSRTIKVKKTAFQKEKDEKKTAYTEKIQAIKEEKKYAAAVSRYTKTKEKMTHLIAILEKDSFSFTMTEMSTILTMPQSPAPLKHEAKKPPNIPQPSAPPASPPPSFTQHLPIAPSSLQPGEREEKEDTDEMQPGRAEGTPLQHTPYRCLSELKVVEPLNIAAESSNDPENIKTILSELLKQAHRLHRDNSYFLSSGTDKAFDIIYELSFLLAKIENNEPGYIAEKIKEACTQPKIKSLNEGDESLHENPLYIALHRKRNCCGFFTPSSAEAMNNLINPPKEKTLPEILAGRFAWYIPLK